MSIKRTPRLPATANLTKSEAHELSDKAISELNEWQLESYLNHSSEYALITAIQKLEAKEATGRNQRFTSEEIEELQNTILEQMSESQMDSYLYAKEQENPDEYQVYFKYIPDDIVRGMVKLEQRVRILTVV